MFTDLESSTALTQRLGDIAAQRVLYGHNDAVRKSLTNNGGREVKHTGDGIMAAFPSAVRAIESAVQTQRDRAEPGQVLVRRVVADLCAGKQLTFTHHSDATLKGFEEPVRAWSVEW